MPKKFFLFLLSSVLIFSAKMTLATETYKINELSSFGFLAGGKTGIKPKAAVELKTPWLRPHPGKAIWGKIEKEKGKFNWQELDKIVKTAQKENLNLLITIWPYAAWDQNQCHKNLKKAKGFEKDLPKKRGAPCNYLAYKNFLKKLVERYDGDGKGDMKGLKYGIKYWEILNEPEMNKGNLIFFQGKADDYLKILKESYKTIKKADKNAKVVVAGMAGMSERSQKFWKRIFSKKGGKYFDIGNVHCLSCNVADLNATSYKNLLEKYNIHKPFWITEVQITSYEPQQAFVSQAKSEEEQAATIIKSYLQAYAAGAEKIFYSVYQAKENLPENLRYAALIEDGRLKPAYYAMKTMANKIDWFSKIEKIAQGQYKFTIGPRTVYILWQETETPEIPNELKGKTVIVTDMGGNVETKKGEEININPDPLFVEFP